MSIVKSLVLNQDQEAAAQAIFQFLLSDDKEFSISGPAGTGKTTLMQHVMQTLLPEYETACKLLGETPRPFTVALTATTNKATEVLARATGFPAVTIHSFMNLKLHDDYKTGVSKVVPTNNWQVHRNKLIFVDEASMIDRMLYDFIRKGTDKTCKIIYLGDRCQMAPVLEKISPVYQNQQHAVELGIPMRNSGQPALMALCDQLRANVDTQDFHPILPVPGVIDYVDDAQAQAFIDATFAAETPSARVLCFTNERVTRYNEYIRSLRGYPEHFVSGERVISASGTQIGSFAIRVEEAFKIVDLQPVPRTIPFDGGQAEIDVYTAVLRNHRTDHLAVHLPASPEHHRALMRHYKGLKKWPVYYWLKNSFPDLRPRDAATVYKAQGSTYHTVFLDLANIGKCTNDDQVARMLYVGASRATTRLVLYGQLPARFSQKREAAQAVA